MLTLFLSYLDDDNDKRIFEEIYYSYRKQMVTMALSILYNEADAEDAVSNVFLRIATKNWDVVRDIKSCIDLRNYLLKATKNTSLNMLKDKNKKNVSLDTVLEYNADSTKNLTDDSFLENICNKIEYEEIIKAISSLDEKYRDVLYYHFVMELSIPNTAKLLNQTLHATKKQLVRGKKMLLYLLGI